MNVNEYLASLTQLDRAYLYRDAAKHCRKIVKFCENVFATPEQREQFHPGMTPEQIATNHVLWRCHNEYAPGEWRDAFTEVCRRIMEGQ
jgi:hypothetical protein